MLYLLIVSMIWSASFGIFKTHLSSLDPSLMAFIRLSLAFAVFVPLLRINKLSRHERVTFFGIGVIQYGMMYLLLNQSFAYLEGWQVALMTLFTPIYIVLIDGIRKRHLDWVFLLAAIMAVGGAAIVMQKCLCIPRSALTGCLLVQLADVSFALGQLLYKDARKTTVAVKDRELYALLFAGGAVISLIGLLISGKADQIGIMTDVQWYAVVYMGIVASGMCFFLWNIGVTKVSTGTLATMSNMKVPMAVFVSLVFFGETAGSWSKLLIGAAIMITAVIIVQKRARFLA